MAARQHVKLSSNVAIPLQGLDLAPFASESASLEEEGAMYDLYALANHSGSVDSGHYTAHAKVLTQQNTENTQPWYLFADDRVHEVCLSLPVHRCCCCQYLKSEHSELFCNLLSGRCTDRWVSHDKTLLAETSECICR